MAKQITGCRPHATHLSTEHKCTKTHKHSRAYCVLQHNIK